MKKILNIGGVLMNIFMGQCYIHMEKRMKSQINVLPMSHGTIIRVFYIGKYHFMIFKRRGDMVV